MPRNHESQTTRQIKAYIEKYFVYYNSNATIPCYSLVNKPDINAEDLADLLNPGSINEPLFNDARVTVECLLACEEKIYRDKSTIPHKPTIIDRDNGKFFNLTIEAGSTLMHFAAQMHDVRLCKKCINIGAKQHVTNRSNYTPLDIACANPANPTIIIIFQAAMTASSDIPPYITEALVRFTKTLYDHDMSYSQNVTQIIENIEEEHLVSHIKAGNQSALHNKISDLHRTSLLELPLCHIIGSGNYEHYEIHDALAYLIPSALDISVLSCTKFANTVTRNVLNQILITDIDDNKRLRVELLTTLPIGSLVSYDWEATSHQYLTKNIRENQYKHHTPAAHFLAHVLRHQKFCSNYNAMSLIMTTFFSSTSSYHDKTAYSRDFSIIKGVVLCAAINHDSIDKFINVVNFIRHDIAYTNMILRSCYDRINALVKETTSSTDNAIVKKLTKILFGNHYCHITAMLHNFLATNKAYFTHLICHDASNTLDNLKIFITDNTFITHRKKLCTKILQFLINEWHKRKITPSDEATPLGRIFFINKTLSLVLRLTLPLEPKIILDAIEGRKLSLYDIFISGAWQEMTDYLADVKNDCDKFNTFRKLQEVMSNNAMVTTSTPNDTQPTDLCKSIIAPIIETWQHWQDSAVKPLWDFMYLLAGTGDIALQLKNLQRHFPSTTAKTLSDELFRNIFQYYIDDWCRLKNSLDIPKLCAIPHMVKLKYAIVFILTLKYNPEIVWDALRQQLISLSDITLLDIWRYIDRYVARNRPINQTTYRLTNKGITDHNITYILFHTSPVHYDRQQLTALRNIHDIISDNTSFSYQDSPQLYEWQKALSYYSNEPLKALEVFLSLEMILWELRFTKPSKPIYNDLLHNVLCRRALALTTKQWVAFRDANANNLPVLFQTSCKTHEILSKTLYIICYYHPPTLLKALQENSLTIYDIIMLRLVEQLSARINSDITFANPYNAQNDLVQLILKLKQYTVDYLSYESIHECLATTWPALVTTDLVRYFTLFHTFFCKPAILLEIVEIFTTLLQNNPSKTILTEETVCHKILLSVIEKWNKFKLLPLDKNDKEQLRDVFLCPTLRYTIHCVVLYYPHLLQEIMEKKLFSLCDVLCSGSMKIILQIRDDSKIVLSVNAANTVTILANKLVKLTQNMDKVLLDFILHPLIPKSIMASRVHIKCNILKYKMLEYLVCHPSKTPNIPRIACLVEAINQSFFAIKNEEGALRNDYEANLTEITELLYQFIMSYNFSSQIAEAMIWADLLNILTQSDMDCMLCTIIKQIGAYNFYNKPHTLWLSLSSQHIQPDILLSESYLAAIQEIIEYPLKAALSVTEKADATEMQNYKHCILKHWIKLIDFFENLNENQSKKLQKALKGELTKLTEALIQYNLDDNVTVILTKEILDFAALQQIRDIIIRYLLDNSSNESRDMFNVLSCATAECTSNEEPINLLDNYNSRPLTSHSETQSNDINYIL